MRYYVEIPISESLQEEIRLGIPPEQHEAHVRSVLLTILFHRVIECVTPTTASINKTTRHPTFTFQNGDESEKVLGMVEQHIKEYLKELSWLLAGKSQRYVTPISRPTSSYSSLGSVASNRKQSPSATKAGAPQETIDEANLSITVRCSQANDDDEWETWTIAPRVSNCFKVVIQGNSENVGKYHSLKKFILCISEICYELGKDHVINKKSPFRFTIGVSTGLSDEDGESKDFVSWKKLIKKMLKPSREEEDLSYPL